MSVFSDYKLYKKYYPNYAEWKHNRNIFDAKAAEYLRQNPQEINSEDIQRGKALLRAIDTMDEYSQKRAENMEVATDSVVSLGLGAAAAIGTSVGTIFANKNFVKNFFKKHFKNVKPNMVMPITVAATTILSATAVIFPLYSWAAKQEVKASRKGRFEAMRKELDNPKLFAALTPEQEEELNNKLKNVNGTKIKDDKELKGLRKTLDSIKEMTGETKEYIAQKRNFEKRLEDDKKYYDEPVSPKEIEKAKKDQQLLTKLVEKIDIASQDYAENIELATSAITTLIFGFGTLFSLGFAKLAQKLKLPTFIAASPAVLGYIAMVAFSLISASIQKEASRVGRYVVKRDLENHPEELVYVDKENTDSVDNYELKKDKKPGIFKFYKEAIKNNREYKKWKKTSAAKEKETKNILTKTEFSDEQLKDARRLQHNTFKTFNKIDENSQKYSESIEALGTSIAYPLTMIFTTIGLAIGLKFLKMPAKATSSDKLNGFLKYFSCVFLSNLPAIFINAYVTKEQKKASRVADMLAINELNDYRNFVDYSDYRKESLKSRT